MWDDSVDAELRNARQHVRDAMQAAGERIVGHDVSSHLRSALRSMLRAGLSHLDRADARAARSSADAHRPLATPHAPHSPPMPPAPV